MTFPSLSRMFKMGLEVRVGQWKGVQNRERRS